MSAYILQNALRYVQDLSKGMNNMSDFGKVLWASPDTAEQITFISGYYKLMTRQEMIPLGKTVEEVKEKLKWFKRNDILESFHA